MAGTIIFGRKFLNEERAMELYNMGCTDQEIANQLDCVKETVRRWRRKNNLAKNEEKKAPPSLIELAAEANAHGMTYGEYMAARREGRA